ncbi:hypothetical protein PCASD_05729 [Puccinia coronata f. sp. avenae]|uniref:GH18 domain-containing protein n=1 Tax=Puccinia coronata f. sp. avenae TaxID=200324 RepID=A0A2N5TFC3_9BASI|nr:hypothetical protein PCASD_06687 [Puccinia coronata f. sp. avenae]PLW37845.1 hypothetical protein PCASD_05729 [Puccinia coronata f. sp. avenae]
MFRQVHTIIFMLVALLLGAYTNAEMADGQTALQVKGYYPSYNSEAQPPSSIDWSAYTDVFYFAMIPQENFTLSYDPSLTWAQGEKQVAEFVAEARKHNVNPIFSAGGWGGSQKFSILTQTGTSRKRFARLLVHFGKRHGFGGIEMDWEYPNGDGIGCNTKDPADVVNFGKLVKEIRAQWPEACLSAAVSINGLIGADGSPATTAETALLNRYLDFVNLMAYDVYGPWAPTTGPIAPLNGTCSPSDYALSVDTGVQMILKQGFKPSQIILGIPTHAYRLELSSPELVPRTVNGQTSYFYQNHTAATPPGGKSDGQPGLDICGNNQTWGGTFVVTELISNGWLSPDQKNGLNGYQVYRDACSGAPFLTNGQYFITYDDEDSTISKAVYAKDNQLGGIYFFDTAGAPPSTIREAGKHMYA